MVVGGSSLRILDIKTENIIHELIGHTDSVRTLSLSRNQKYLASGGSDFKIYVWDVDTGK